MVWIGLQHAWGANDLGDFRFWHLPDLLHVCAMSAYQGQPVDSCSIIVSEPAFTRVQPSDELCQGLRAGGRPMPLFGIML
jgi:hypothetical protein